MYCSVSAEISFQSGNFRYLSFWSQKQNPTLRLCLMAPQDTHARVILSYIITTCLHTLSMCFSRVFCFLFQTVLCLFLNITRWLVSSGGWIKHCWLWLNSNAQAQDQERECRAQQAHLSIMWSSVSQVFSDPSAGRGQRQVLPPNASWAGLWHEEQLEFSILGFRITWYFLYLSSRFSILDGKAVFPAGVILEETSALRGSSMLIFYK